MGLRRTAVALATAALAGGLVAVTAGPAFASTVSVTGSTLSFSAAPGEANNVEVEGGAGLDFSLEDLGAPLTPGPGCTSVGPHRATCGSAGVTSITFDTGDLNDIVTNNTPLPSSIQGGCGNDVLEGGSAADTIYGDPSGCPRPGNDTIDGRGGSDRVFGGPGDDTVRGNAGADTLVGGPGVDRLEGGGGPDVLVSNDTFADTDVCGSGNDRVRADSSDSVASDCEHVQG